MDKQIKLLRKTLKLTQEEFSKKIGIKRNTLANYEIGRNKPIDGIIFSICRVFNVNENWLRTGEGDMFVPVDDLDMRMEYVSELLYNDKSSFHGLINNILVAYSQLSQTEMEAVDKIIDKVLDDYRGNNPVTAENIKEN